MGSLYAGIRGIGICIPKVTWNKHKVQIDGFEVRYSTDAKMKNAKSTVVNENSKTSVTVKDLKQNQEYYVQLRTYKEVGGKKYYSDWSKIKTVKTK